MTVGRGIDARYKDLIGGLRLSGRTAVAVIALKLSEALSKTLCSAGFALLELHNSSSKLFCSSDIGGMTCSICRGFPEHARLTECDKATLPNKIIGESCHFCIFLPQMVSLL